MLEPRRVNRILADVKAGGMKGTTTAKVIAADAMIRVTCVLGISELMLDFLSEQNLTAIVDGCELCMS